MRKETLERVRRSVAAVLPQAADVTARFHDRLFAVVPDLRGLFPTDLAAHQRQFAAAMAVILRNLSMMDVLSDPLRQLGIGHAAAGVRPQHYPVFRDAMLFALGRTLADEWSPELEADWGELIDGVSRILMSGGTSALRP